MFVKLLKIKNVGLALLLLYSIGVSVQAQNRGIGDSEDPAERWAARHQRSMLAEMRVKRAKVLHEEHLERAREVADLASGLKTHFNNHNNLGNDERKAVEKLEKLVKRLRRYAGGDDDADGTSSLKKIGIGEAISELYEQSIQLQTEITKSSRFVASQSIVERCNRLLELTALLRTR